MMSFKRFVSAAFLSLLSVPAVAQSAYGPTPGVNGGGGSSSITGPSGYMAGWNSQGQLTSVNPGRIDATRVCGNIGPGGLSQCVTPSPQTESGTALLTLGSPGVVNWTGANFPTNGSPISFTGGVLPTGVTSGVVYYVAQTTSQNSFNIATTPGGTPINFTGSTSGSQTIKVNYDNTQFIPLMNQALCASATATGCGRELFFPVSVPQNPTAYYFSQPLDISRTGAVTCEGTAAYGAANVYLIFPAGVPGVRADTTLASPWEKGLASNVTFSGCGIQYQGASASIPTPTQWYQEASLGSTAITNPLSLMAAAGVINPGFQPGDAVIGSTATKVWWDDFGLALPFGETLTAASSTALTLGTAPQPCPPFGTSAIINGGSGNCLASSAGFTVAAGNSPTGDSTVWTLTSSFAWPKNNKISFVPPLLPGAQVYLGGTLVGTLEGSLQITGGSAAFAGSAGDTITISKTAQATVTTTAFKAWNAGDANVFVNACGNSNVPSSLQAAGVSGSTITDTTTGQVIGTTSAACSSATTGTLGSTSATMTCFTVNGGTCNATPRTWTGTGYVYGNIFHQTSTGTGTIAVGDILTGTGVPSPGNATPAQSIAISATGAALYQGDVAAFYLTTKITTIQSQTFSTAQPYYVYGPRSLMLWRLPASEAHSIVVTNGVNTVTEDFTASQNTICTGVQFTTGSPVISGGTCTGAALAVGANITAPQFGISTTVLSVNGGGSYTLSQNATCTTSSSTNGTGCNAQAMAATPQQSWLAGDTIYTQPFPFGTIIFYVRATAGASSSVPPVRTYTLETAVDTAAQQPLSGFANGTYSAWAVPYGFEIQNTARADHMYVQGFPINVALPCAGGGAPAFNCTSVKIDMVDASQGLIGRFDVSNNTSGSTYGNGFYVYNFLTDIASLGELGEWNPGDLAECAEDGGTCLLPRLENCANLNTTTPTVQYVWGDQWTCVTQSSPYMVPPAMKGVGANGFLNINPVVQTPSDGYSIGPGYLQGSWSFSRNVGEPCTEVTNQIDSPYLLSLEPTCTGTTSGAVSWAYAPGIGGIINMPTNTYLGWWLGYPSYNWKGRLDAGSSNSYGLPDWQYGYGIGVPGTEIYFGAPVSVRPADVATISVTAAASWAAGDTTISLSGGVCPSAPAVAAGQNIYDTTAPARRIGSVASCAAGVLTLKGTGGAAFASAGAADVLSIGLGMKGDVRENSAPAPGGTAEWVNTDNAHAAFYPAAPVALDTAGTTWSFANLQSGVTLTATASSSFALAATSIPVASCPAGTAAGMGVWDTSLATPTLIGRLSGACAASALPLVGAGTFSASFGAADSLQIAAVPNLNYGLVLGGAPVTTLATGSDVAAMNSSTKPITPKALADAVNPNALTCASNTVSWDMSVIVNATLALGSGCTGATVSNPTNIKPGATYMLSVGQDVSGSRTISTWGSYFDWAAVGSPAQSTGANLIDDYVCYAYTATSLHCSVANKGF